MFMPCFQGFMLVFMYFRQVSMFKVFHVYFSVFPSLGLLSVITSKSSVLCFHSSALGSSVLYSTRPSALALISHVEAVSMSHTVCCIFLWAFHLTSEEIQVLQNLIKTPRLLHIVSMNKSRLLRLSALHRQPPLSLVQRSLLCIVCSTEALWRRQLTQKHSINT